MKIIDYNEDYTRIPIRKIEIGDVFAYKYNNIDSVDNNYKYFIKTDLFDKGKVACINLETGEFEWFCLKHENFENECSFIKCTATLKVLKERN